MEFFVIKAIFLLKPELYLYNIKYNYYIIFKRCEVLKHQLFIHSPSFPFPLSGFLNIWDKKIKKFLK